jgi:hypothetical protein
MTKQILAFFCLLHKRAKPILPPYLLPHSARELKPYTPPLPSLSTHPSTHSLNPTLNPSVARISAQTQAFCPVTKDSVFIESS